MTDDSVTLAAGSYDTFGVDDLACATATDLGLWAEEGLDVEWIPRRGGKASMEAVLEGDADVAYAGLGPVIKLRAEGNPCRIFVSMARALAQNLVARPSIETTDDLVGATWAIDGFDALSHHMAQVVVDALENVDESDIDWEAVGPPPERIDRLFDGTVDASLIRVEEATALSRTHPEKIHTLLGFGELKELAPVQPHGVLATTEAFERERPETVAKLTRGMLRASRELYESQQTFRERVEANVEVSLEPEEIEQIWQQEHDSGGFAVNGELSHEHWDRQFEDYFELYPDLRRVSRDDLLAEQFVADALESLGRHSAAFDRTGR